jgi:hypothetical protein
MMEENYAVMPASLRTAAAKLKSRAAVADEEVVPVAASRAFPLSALLEERRLAEEKRIKDEADLALLMDPARDPSALLGQMFEGRGIFIGRYAPRDRDDESLGKVFNAFAAPEDLKDNQGKRALLQYKDAVDWVGALRDWHGHNGFRSLNDTTLLRELKENAYDGGWIIPTSDLLTGKDFNGKETGSGNILACHGKDMLKGTFGAAGKTSAGFPGLYWSCTETNDNLFYVFYACPQNGISSGTHKSAQSMSCRPVRLELLPGASP